MREHLLLIIAALIFFIAPITLLVLCAFLGRAAEDIDRDYGDISHSPSSLHQVRRINHEREQ